MAGKDIPINPRQIGTLHSHCYRALDSPRIAETYINRWNEYAPEFKLNAVNDESVLDSPKEQIVGGNEAEKIFLKYQNLRNKIIDRKLWPYTVQAFAKKWEHWKEYEIDAIDFTDMIEMGLDFIGPPGDPKIGFYDEVQDFTPLELKLIRYWSKDMDYILLSMDDDQTIFSFKGADPIACLKPALPKDQIRVLNQSYRVPRKIQVIAQKWIEKVTERQPKEYKPKKGVEGEIRKLNGGNWKYPKMLVGDVDKYIKKGKKIMFLTSCSYMLEPLKVELRKQGVPFYNPYRKKRGDWNPLTPDRGISSSERLLAFLRPNYDTWGELTRMWTIEDLSKWIPLINSKGIMKNGTKNKIKKLAEDDDIKNKEVNIDDMLQWFTEDGLNQVINSMTNTNIDWFNENIIASKKKGMQFPLNIAKKSGTKKLVKEPQVIIGTIHSVKGGEAEIVYLFPDLSASGLREWIIPGTSRDAIIRQFYVGMTRTKETLIFCSPSSSTAIQII